MDHVEYMILFMAEMDYMTRFIRRSATIQSNIVTTEYNDYLILFE